MNGRPRILCVEDNGSLRKNLARGLIRFGFEVILAAHGIEGVSQFNAHNGNFSAIVTDHDMPEMNGLELIRYIRRLGYTGQVVVISADLQVDELIAYHFRYAGSITNRLRSIYSHACSCLQSYLDLVSDKWRTTLLMIELVWLREEFHLEL